MLVSASPDVSSKTLGPPLLLAQGRFSSDSVSMPSPWQLAGGVLLVLVLQGALYFCVKLYHTRAMFRGLVSSPGRPGVLGHGVMPG